MPRHNKNKGGTLPAEAPGLEAGAAYGEQGQNLMAQDPETGVPLPDRRTQGGPVSAIAPSAPEPGGPAPALPIDVAGNFPNTVTPLTAPGQGINQTSSPVTISNEMRAAELLKQWADASGDPSVKNAASQLSGRLLNNG